MIEEHLFIQNVWKRSAESIESINPATLEPIGRAGSGSQQDCMEAIQAAKQAHPSWKEIPLQSKKAIFRKAKQILLERYLEISQLITKEKGSPLLESMVMEVISALESLDYYIHNMDALLKPEKMKHHMVLFNHKKVLPLVLFGSTRKKSHNIDLNDTFLVKDKKKESSLQFHQGNPPDTEKMNCF